jgi:hypothetical protein
VLQAAEVRGDLHAAVLGRVAGLDVGRFHTVPSGNVWGTFGEGLGPFRERLSPFRERLGNVWETFGERLGPFRERLGLFKERFSQFRVGTN